MADNFSHENLDVYQKALHFAARIDVIASEWSGGNAFVDHLIRSSESIAVNLAAGCGFRKPDQKAKCADYVLGSILESAACLDIAHVKRLLEDNTRTKGKHFLLDMYKMATGLRNAWEQRNDGIGEQQSAYNACHGDVVFCHEELDAYRKGLAFMDWFTELQQGNDIPGRLRETLDKSATSIALNIAEGNGRYSTRDHKRFLRIAQKSAMKCGAYIDLAVQRGIIPEPEARKGKDHAVSTTNLLIGLEKAL